MSNASQSGKMRTVPHSWPNCSTVSPGMCRIHDQVSLMCPCMCPIHDQVSPMCPCMCPNHDQVSPMCRCMCPLHCQISPMCPLACAPFMSVFIRRVCLKNISNNCFPCQRGIFLASKSLTRWNLPLVGGSCGHIMVFWDPFPIEGFPTKT